LEIASRTAMGTSLDPGGREGAAAKHAFSYENGLDQPSGVQYGAGGRGPELRDGEEPKAALEELV
jgi:hypothetical protein